MPPLRHLAPLLAALDSGSPPGSWPAATASAAIALATMTLFGAAFLAETAGGVKRRSQRGIRWLTATAGALACALIVVLMLGSLAASASAAWQGVAATTVDAAPAWLAGVVLLGACAAGYRATRDRRLIVAALWLAALTATLLALATTTAGGAGNRRLLPDVAPGWALGLAAVLGAFVAAEGILELRRRNRLAWENQDELNAPASRWPYFAGSCVALGAGLVVLIGLGLVWPVAWGRGGFHTASWALASAGLIGAVALFTLANRSWTTVRADFAQALLTLAVCAAALGALPGQPTALAQRMPLHLNVLVMVLAGMAGFWMWIARVWAQQLDGGRPWTTAGRLHGEAPRFSLGNAALGVCVAWLMTVWPHLADMPSRDAAFERMTLGVAGHLLLILVLLVGGRTWRRVEFYVLAAAGAVSLVAFIIVRTADYVTIVR